MLFNALKSKFRAVIHLRESYFQAVYLYLQDNVFLIFKACPDFNLNPLNLRFKRMKEAPAAN